MFKHKAKKRFGQNFLCDENIISQIIHFIAPKKGDHLVEIGPGLGAITIPLLSLVEHMDAIELDTTIIPLLQKKSSGIGSLTIYQQDALSFDFRQLTLGEKSLRIVGNLPYNISTPLLFRLFSQKNLIKDMYFMLQKEVAGRLAARPGSKQFGRLTIMAQYHCHIEKLIDVPPTSFKPMPKVDSTFIRLIPKPEPTLLAKDLNQLDEVVRQAFTKRRKQLQNALKNKVTKDQLLSLGIDPQLRPEELTIENFVKISNMLE